MTPTATYIAEENCLQEQLPPELDPAIHDANAHPELYDEYKACVATLRKTPCDISCKGLWADGQKVVEGKDYEVRFMQCPECWLLVESFNCQECKHVAFPLVPAGEPDMPNLILTAFQNEPVAFLLSNALRHLTQDQQRQLCNALLERLPVPVSIEDEAEGLYPYHPQNDEMYTDSMVTNIQRSAHITCARQYIDTIEKLRAENEQLKKELQAIKEEHDFRNKPLM